MSDMTIKILMFLFALAFLVATIGSFLAKDYVASLMGALWLGFVIGWTKHYWKYM
jgi:hypothetical protein